MTRRRRWFLVALVAAVLAATPALPDLRPAAASDESAAALLDRVRGATDLPWSGEVRTRGTLQLPGSDAFAGVARLLGDDARLRVWWRDDRHWRVDRIRRTGETDVVREGDRVVRWSFESDVAVVSPHSAVRLPDAPDLLPSRLAARLLAGARPAEVERLDQRRVAGRSAAGLRLRPADARSTIDHVDVWADERNALPLEVRVHAVGDRVPVVSAVVTSLDPGEPAAGTTTFRAAPGTTVRREDAVDLAAAANLFAPFVLPARVAGLERRGTSEDLGAVGVYGRGPTAVLAVPLRRGAATRLRRQLSSSAAADATADGTALRVGPLSVLLTPRGRGRGTFLLAGTVDPGTLAAAATDLREGVRPR